MIKVSQWFGENPEYYQQFGLPGHDGLDFVAPIGTPIFAAAQGIVFSVSSVGNYGLHIRIRHDGDHESVYAHLSEAHVNSGDMVSGGQIIGKSGNTGNSTGPHLHFGEKKIGFQYVDENGNVWPYNLRDPWLHLVHIYGLWLFSNGIKGYIYESSTVPNLQKSYVRTVGKLNVRESPQSTGNLLGVTPKYGVAQVIGEPINGYLPVLTPVDTQQYSNPGVGLHLRADPDLAKPGEWNEIATLATSPTPRFVKLLHAHPRENYTQAISTLGNSCTYVIRVFQHWGGRNISPGEFVQWTKDDLINRIQLLKQNGISNILLELHNEPNLVSEGLGYSWKNGEEFMAWCQQVITGYNLSGVKWVYPGLSPGGDIAGVRYDSDRFFRESLLSIGLFDIIGVHSYWSDSFGMDIALDQVDRVRGLVSKSILITECSRNDRPATHPYEQYGTEYAQFVKLLRRRSNILGVLFFVGSASNPVFLPECWVSESNQVHGIANALVRGL